MKKKFYKYMNSVITSAIYDFNKENKTEYEWREDKTDSDTILVFDENTGDDICQLTVAALGDEDDEECEDCDDDEC